MADEMMLNFALEAAIIDKNENNGKANQWTCLPVLLI